MNTCSWCGKKRKKLLLYQQRLCCILCHNGIIKAELHAYNQIMTRTHADIEIDHLQQFRKVMSRQYASSRQFVKTLSRLYNERTAAHAKYAHGKTVKLSASKIRQAQQQPYQEILSYLQQKKESLK